MGTTGTAVEDAVTGWIERQLGRTAGGLARARDAAGAAADPAGAIASLPGPSRKEAAAILARIVVGPPSAADALADATAVDEAVFHTVVRAFVRAQPVALLYRDASGTTTERRVEPHGLLVRAPLWYVLGFDKRKDSGRMFRLDRVCSAHFMIGPRFEPEDPRSLFENLEGRTFDVG